MKKFKFKLEPLLRYRSFQEHQKKLAVAAARHDVMICEAAIEEMTLLSRATAETLSSAMTNGMDAIRFEWYNHYLEGLSSLRVSQEARRLELIRALARKQQELTEKSVARKVVENLKARKKEDYYREALKTEQKTLDDMVILRSARKVAE
ncbi:MAG: flagellar export protein FliJ [Pseudomonadota bacterium]